MHRGAFCQFTFQWIHYYDSNKSNGLETGKSHLCAVGRICLFPLMGIGITDLPKNLEATGLPGPLGSGITECDTAKYFEKFSKLSNVRLCLHCGNNRCTDTKLKKEAGKNLQGSLPKPVYMNESQGCSEGHGPE